MKEIEFINEMNKGCFENEKFEVSICYSLDENDNVILDEESMQDEFNNRLDEIEEVLK